MYKTYIYIYISLYIVYLHKSYFVIKDQIKSSDSHCCFFAPFIYDLFKIIQKLQSHSLLQAICQTKHTKLFRSFPQPQYTQSPQW